MTVYAGGWNMPASRLVRWDFSRTSPGPPQEMKLCMNKAISPPRSRLRAQRRYKRNCERARDGELRTPLAQASRAGLSCLSHRRAAERQSESETPPSFSPSVPPPASAQRSAPVKKSDGATRHRAGCGTYVCGCHTAATHIGAAGGGS